MMYNDKFVAALKVNGKILKEFNDTIYIPFQSEYSILLKNLTSFQKALVNITIDGNEVISGLVLYPLQEIDLERSIVNNNLTEGNKFKFIERTTSIEEYRGIKLEDGLVQIKFKFEEIQTRVRSMGFNNDPCLYDSSVAFASAGTINCCSGITVPGSHSNQEFNLTSSFNTEDITHTIIFKLMGTRNNNIVNKPISTKTKQKCITCGKVNKISSKFCSNCGTSLTIV